MVLYAAGVLGLVRQSRDPGETSFRKTRPANQKGAGQGTGTRHLTGGMEGGREGRTDSLNKDVE